jgi:dolichol-phosphate mannosyltransferase
MDARVVREIVRLGERDRYLPGLRSWVGYRQKGIEIRRGARYDGRPRVSLRSLWRLAKTAVYSFSTFPLALFSTIGYTALAVFMALSGYSLICRLFTELAVPGWTSSVLVGSFFGAVNALGISILGEYVVRIYDQVRGRPLYLVARHMNAASETSPANVQAMPEPGDIPYDRVWHDSSELLELADAVRAGLDAEPLSRDDGS